ncbi:hypothetical protein Taro_041404 [Colocasia esculenta]|uniref:Uncharacterized protein n=1 Tax=Colocasia esculenta TaxID=4460 RepID=A0A843WLK7_COLES|nr:hypothetical protein [Colocasia esculenta]
MDLTSGENQSGSAANENGGIRNDQDIPISSDLGSSDLRGSGRDHLGCPETENPTYDKMKARSLQHAYIIARPRSLRHSELLKARSLRHAYVIACSRSLRHSELLKARSLQHAYIIAHPRSLRHSELLKARSLRHAYDIARPRSLRPSELLKVWSLRHTRTQLIRGRFGPPSS